ncbi:MAG: phosphoglycerate kinase [Candidatus Levybacteria bacterium]|nr:phosphoglycerate kinase [Candidatus Levybacteria bacterium]
MELRTIDTIKDLSGKTVLLRIDCDVDIENGRILDDTRLDVALPTIEFLLKKGADINIVGHLGRPKTTDNGQLTTDNSKFTLVPIAHWFAKKFKVQSSKYKVGKFEAWKITDRINLIENIRFFKGEEDNPSSASGRAFARDLALLGDVYVNDAFAVSHRAHASIVGVTKFLPSYAGLHLKKEVHELSKILNNPPPGQRPSGAAKRPLAVLIGGAKIETKLPLVSKMHAIADYVLVGGEIAEQTRVLIKVQHEKIKEPKSAVLVADLREDGFDITPKSIENFKQILGLAGTIVWNGPVGLIRPPIQNSKFKIQNSEDTERGTRELAQFIVRTSAYKVVGGGDTLAYLRRIDLLSKFDFVSMGGGAMLEFLSGHKLPALKTLEK